ncbi:DUF1127 domain-containing protein [Azospirillum agricola]|uniref:DUF1127 domain-containing protein n=1 Tax=Azospirillum agricola TaxID=1720247 RepID=UPI000A0EF6FE|nr:DUF1127 domain-containing protein [Azospirillum agricola]MBP2228238.1 uncharacterized protein YjiS (DUF1127 family) [Azospirillum agricola]SMH54490.1 protein of unknown function [Azospirillum lipoferum]
MATLLHSADAGRGTLSFAHIVESASNMFGLWRQRIVTRRELGRLDERMLQDIGFSRLDADQEMSKPFWRE